MGKHTVQRARDPGEIQRRDEQGGGSDLPAAVGAQEAPELLLLGPSLPRRLPLEGAERFEVTLSVDDPFNGGDSQGTDQLVFQVRDTHEEAESLHAGAREVGAETGPFETALEVALLCRVTEARQSDVGPPTAEPIQEAPDVLRPSHGHDADAFGIQVAAAPLRQRLECELVADPFDEHDRWRDEALGRRWAIGVGVDPCPLVMCPLHAHTVSSASGVGADRGRP